MFGKFPHSKDLIRAFILLKDLILSPLQSSLWFKFWACAYIDSIYMDTSHKKKLFQVKNCKATMSYREILMEQVCKKLLEETVA